MRIEMEVNEDVVMWFLGVLIGASLPLVTYFVLETIRSLGGG